MIKIASPPSISTEGTNLKTSTSALLPLEGHRYQLETILTNKNVSYDTQLCPMNATPTDAPNADVKQQIAQGHSQELKSSSPKSQVLRKTVSL